MKKSSNFIKVFIAFIFVFHSMIDVTRAVTNSGDLEKIKNAVVTINTRVAISAYDNTGSVSGTGFIVDKIKGIIVTNRHVIGRASVGQYLVTFNNGRQAEAKLIYYDSWQDYAFLQVDKDAMPEIPTEISFAESPPKLNQKIFIVGNNEAREFSFHNGYISSLYAIDGEMPQGSYVINLNSAGGSSGSPVVSDNNEAVGIIYGGGRTFSLALNAEYLKTALKQIQNNKIPIRKHIGIFPELYSLDKAIKHRSFPADLAQEYTKKFPASRNKIIAVNKIIAGAPAQNILKPGDIIWEIAGKQVGADLCKMDQLMDDNPNDKIKIVIYREGQKIIQEVPLYNVNDNKIEKIVEFGGALIFESDDLFSSKTGVPIKSIAVNNVQTGSAFSVIPVSFREDNKNIYRLMIHAINGHQLANLNDLITLIPKIVTKKFINIKFRNYQPYYPYYEYTDRTFNSAQEDLQTDIELDNIDSNSRIFKFNNQSLEWEAENIK